MILKISNERPEHCLFQNKEQESRQCENTMTVKVWKIITISFFCPSFKYKLSKINLINC